MGGWDVGTKERRAVLAIWSNSPGDNNYLECPLRVPCLGPAGQVLIRQGRTQPVNHLHFSVNSIATSPLPKGLIRQPEPSRQMQDSVPGITEKRIGHGAFNYTVTAFSARFSHP